MEESLLRKSRNMIMIQYMDSSMADELLSKFPDNSAFDFDYSQSSIWSPLVPRFHPLSCLENPKSPNLRKRLEFGNDCKVFDKMPLSKICGLGLNLNSRFGNKRKTKNPSQIKHCSSSPPRKGWKKVLKMTTKQFKKKRDNHHHYHHSLADYFQSPNF